MVKTQGSMTLKNHTPHAGCADDASVVATRLVEAAESNRRPGS